MLSPVDDLRHARLHLPLAVLKVTRALTSMHTAPHAHARNDEDKGAQHTHINAPTTSQTHQLRTCARNHTKYACTHNRLYTNSQKEEKRTVAYACTHAHTHACKDMHANIHAQMYKQTHMNIYANTQTKDRHTRTQKHMRARTHTHAFV